MPGSEISSQRTSGANEWSRGQFPTKNACCKIKTLHVTHVKLCKLNPPSSRFGVRQCYSDSAIVTDLSLQACVLAV